MLEGNERWIVGFRPLNADGDAAARGPYHRKLYYYRSFLAWAPP